MSYHYYVVFTCYGDTMLSETPKDKDIGQSKHDKTLGVIDVMIFSETGVNDVSRMVKIGVIDDTFSLSTQLCKSITLQ